MPYVRRNRWRHSFRDVVSSVPGLALVLTVALLVGGLVGGLFWAVTPHPVEASTVIRVVNDAEALASPLNDGTTSGDVATAYVSGEVAVLSSDAFAEQVSAATGQPVQPLTVTQVATSDLVTMSTSADDTQTATSILDAAITTYRAARQDAAATRLGAELDTTQSRLTAVRRAGSDEANSTEAARLLAHLSDIVAAQARLDEMVPVVAAPAVVTPKGVGRAALSVMLGAVLVALLVAVTAAVIRLRDQVVRAPSDLTGLGYRVLMPVFDLAAKGSWDSSARIILAQVPNVYTTSRLLLLAVDGDVRADVVASVLSKNAPDVASTQTTPPVRGLPISWHGEPSHVVTVEAVDVGSVLTRRNEPGESVILAAALRSTNRQDVIGASRAVTAAGLTAVGVVLTVNDVDTVRESVRNPGAA